MKYRALILFFLVSCSIYGQFSVNFTDPKSPEVQTFERYIDAPVSEYSGRVNIDIPLYNVEYGDISFPLSLGYNSNGIRVNEEASEVGLGWYFSTGMISQTIQGKDDLRKDHEFKLPDYYSTPYAQFAVDPYPDWYLQWNFYDQEKAFDHLDPDRIQLQSSVPDIDKFSMVRVRSDGCFGYGNVQFPYNGSFDDFDKTDLQIPNPTLGKDLERDIFSANFFGHNIDFYRTNRSSNSTSSFRVMNGENYKVKLVVEDITSIERNHKWEIVTPEGITYHFDEELISSTNRYELTYGLIDSPDNGYGTGVTTSTSLPSFNTLPKYEYSRIWKIKKIVDVKGNEIHFNYESLPTIISISSTSGSTDFKSISQTTSHNQFGPLHFDGPISDPQTSEATGLKAKVNRSGSSRTQERSILKEIVFSNSKIEFTNTVRSDIPGAKKIQSLKVYNDNNEIINIDFNYSYFNPNHSDPKQKRLKLESLSIEDKNYNFYYEGTFLPDKNSNSFDYWGFYNGMSNTTDVDDPFRLFENTGHIPSSIKSLVSQIDGKANRSAHPDHCKVGILTKIKYPTGGTTEFEYELNNFDNVFFPNHDNKIGFTGTNYSTNYAQTFSKGYGLRINEIISYDEDQNVVKNTDYNYSMGKHIIAYNSTNQDNYRSIKYDYGGSGGGYFVDERVYYGPKLTSNFSNIYQTNFLGSRVGIGYDWVEKKVKDAGSSNGKTVSYFTNVPDVSPRNEFGQGGTVPSGYNDLFGYSIKNSDEDNGLITSQVLFDEANDTIQRTDYNYKTIVPDITYQSGNFNSYIYNVKVTNVGSWGYVNHTSGLCSFDEYIFFYYPLKQSKTLLESKKIKQYFTEGIVTNSEYLFYDGAYRKTKEYSMNEAEGYTERLEVRTQYRNSETTYKNILLPSKLTTYRGNKIIDYKLYDYDIPSGNYTRLKQFSDCPDLVYINGQPNYDNCNITDYNKYDTKGNIVEFEFNDSLITTVLWGYEREYPVATIKNATLAEVLTALNLSESNLLNNGVADLSTLSMLRQNLPKALITTYTYDPLIGIKSITDAKGQTTNYHYDNSNRLEYVTDHNGKVLSKNEYNYKN